MRKFCAVIGFFIGIAIIIFGITSAIDDNAHAKYERLYGSEILEATYEQMVLIDYAIIAIGGITTCAFGIVIDTNDKKVVVVPSTNASASTNNAPVAKDELPDL